MNRINKQMRRKGLTLCAVSLFGVGGVFAQSTQGASFKVQQSGETVTALGSASYALDNQTELTIEYGNGKVTVSNGSAVVASLPCFVYDESMGNFNGFTVEFGKSGGDSSLNCSVGSAGYSTLYSPFQLTIPSSSDVEVYAPTYENGKLLLTSNTILAEETVVAPETGLILKNKGSISFPFTNSTSSQISSALSGSSLKISTPTLSGQTIYTLGHATDDASLFGFFKYAGSTLAAGKAYLSTTEALSNSRAFVPFSFGDEITGLHDASVTTSSLADGKYLEKGRVVIVKDGQKYNVSGNRIR